MPKGCKLCVQGRKTVLFITGLCSKHCFYCPISDQKWQKDVVYANEWKIDKFDELVKEIELCSSCGVGITGGDPLIKVNRTCSYIRRLKRKFGDDFHIHLYTPLNLVDESKLRKLYKAGLDEIRFNPDLDKRGIRLWNRIMLAAKYKWDVGVEIPVIPGSMAITKKLIGYIHDKADFLNLNELEISDTNCNELLKRGFAPKDDVSYGVNGSEDMAFKLLSYIEEKCSDKKYISKGYNLRVHYCTATLKDKVQLRNRIKLRAKNYATKFDIVTVDGTLKRTVVYLDELKPGFDYDKKFNSMSQSMRRRFVDRLIKLNDKINGILDLNRLRIIIDRKMISKAKGESDNSNISIAMIEEYPTHDSMLLNVEFI